MEGRVGQRGTSILFVCVENSCRSQMAEAFARMAGVDKLDIYSGGSRPSGTVNPKAATALAELGYDLSKHHSKSVTDLPPIEYDYLVTMGCGDSCPSVRAKHRLEWRIPDPKHMDSQAFAGVRNLLQRQVENLLEAICDQ